MNIDKLAVILNKYPDTNILVEGHTDSSGSEEYNQALSERRAKSVADYAVGQGVSSDRFEIVGYGESQPATTNQTKEGMAQNRRVEIAIFANDKLKKAKLRKGRKLEIDAFTLDEAWSTYLKWRKSRREYYVTSESELIRR